MNEIPQSLIIGCCISGTLLGAVYFFFGVWIKTNTFKRYKEKKLNEYTEYFTHGATDIIRNSKDRYVIVGGAVRKNGRIHFGDFIYDKRTKHFTHLELSIPKAGRNNLIVHTQQLNFEESEYKQLLKSYVQ